MPLLEAESITVIEKYYKRTFMKVSGRGEIEEILEQRGPGSRGIVFGGRIGEPGHVFNAVVNKKGVVKFFDGQTGTVASFTGQGYVGFELLITN